MDVKDELNFFVKIKKNRGGGEGGGGGVGGWSVGGGVRVDVNEELKLLWKCQKYIGVGGVRSGRRWGVEGWGLVDREGVGWQQCWG